MKNNYMLFQIVNYKIILLFIFMLTFLTSTANAYPLMHFTPEEFKEHATLREQMIKLPSVSAKNVQAANQVSLFSKLPIINSKHNQSLCGNCWVWSATSALDIAYNTFANQKKSFSIQYFNSNYNQGGLNGTFACSGGNIGKFVSFYNDASNVLIPWSNTNAEFVDDNGGKKCSTNNLGYCSNRLSSEITTDPAIQMTSLSTQEISTLNISQTKAINNIKSEINAGRAVVLNIFLNDWTEFQNFWKNKGENELFDITPYNGKELDLNKGIGHAVLVIGYNDLSNNPNEHYWEVLNSWGLTSARPNGTLHLKMNINYSSYIIYEKASYGMLAWYSLNSTFANKLDSTTDDIINPTPTPTQTNDPQSSTIFGRMLDINGSGVRDVNVILNNTNQQTTNSDGDFSYKVALNSQNILNFYKQGYNFTPSSLNFNANQNFHSFEILVTADNKYAQCTPQSTDKNNIIDYGFEIYRLGLESKELQFKNVKSAKLYNNYNKQLDSNYAKFVKVSTTLPNIVYTCPKNICKNVNLKKSIRQTKTILKNLNDNIKNLTILKKAAQAIQKNANKNYKNALNALKRMPKTNKQCL